MEINNYPSLLERVKAAFIDSAILILMILLISDAFNAFENVPTVARIIAFVVVFILYDPVLVSFNGGTIGHKIVGLRVKKAIDTNKNILVHLALIRFICKCALGWISLLTITSSSKKQAIHDVLVSSLVVREPKE